MNQQIAQPYVENFEANTNVFIGHAVVDLIDHGISVRLNRQKTVALDSEDPKKSTNLGLFCNDDRMMIVGTAHPFDYWLETFVHEYAHFRQWVEKSPTWRVDTWEEWLEDKKAPADKGWKQLKIMLECELDCERRVIDFTREYKLPINEELYIRRANALFYAFVMSTDKHRYHSPDRRPPQFKSLRNVVPPYLLKHAFDYFVVPDRYREIAERLQCWK